MSSWALPLPGLSAAGAIRSRDPAGSVLLIHGEDRLPYKRTQLSKQLFQGFSRDGLAVHPTEWYLTNRIELLQGTRAVRIEPSPREVFLSTGEVVGYQSLLIATGAEPATLAVAGSEHLTYLRWIHEAEAIALGAREVAKAVSIAFWGPGGGAGGPVCRTGDHDEPGGAQQASHGRSSG